MPFDVYKPININPDPFFETLLIPSTSFPLLNLFSTFFDEWRYKKYFILSKTKKFHAFPSSFFHTKGFPAQSQSMKNNEPLGNKY